MTSKYTITSLQEAVDNSESIRGVLRFLGVKPSGWMHWYIKLKIKEFNINTDHFTGSAHRKNKPSITAKKPIEDILIYRPVELGREKTKHLKRAMLENNIAYVCKCCWISQWNNMPLTLEIDHIDGDSQNNLLNNLRFICPNCHSQQPTNYKTSP